MKKTIILSFILLAFLIQANAQRYSIDKYKYDYRLYVPEYGDPYNPGMSGVCSFILPGLGQMICGETGRGLAFLGAYTGFAVVMEVGAAQLIHSNVDYYGNYTNSSSTGSGTMLIGLGGMVAVGIWSIVDAVHVAKVNDMAIRSLRKTSALKLEMAPYVGQLSINNQTTTPVGMTMRVTF